MKRTLCFFIGIFYFNAFGQVSTAFLSMTTPRSAMTIGIGNQGVALDAGLSSMQFNPAALAFLTSLTFEAGKYDAFIIETYPLTYYRLGFGIEGIGKFAVEYNNMDFGEWTYTTPESPEGMGTYNAKELSFAVTYAGNLSPSVSIGSTVRYSHAKYSYSNDNNANALLLSLGLLYQPEFFNKNLTVGFALTDFGSAVSFVERASDPPPSSMRLGIGISLVSSEYQKLTVLFEGSRFVADVNDQHNAVSSFSAFFSSFKYWPHDIMGHGGLMYEFPKIPITSSLSFHQKLSFGIYDQTNIYYRDNQMLLSAAIGISLPHFSFDVSTASVWQYISENGREYWFSKTIPVEELELRLSYKPDLSLTEGVQPQRLIITGGMGILTPVGRFKDSYLNSGLNYIIETALYTSLSTAIVSTLSYSNNPLTDKYEKLDSEGRFHTYSFSMMYRVDLSENMFPLFFQAGPTLFRFGYSTTSTTISMLPKYKYFGGFVFGAGVPLTFEKLTIQPFISFISMLGNVTGPAPRLGSYNQWSFGIKLGTEI
jgi:hypothetical protein